MLFFLLYALTLDFLMTYRRTVTIDTCISIVPSDICDLLLNRDRRVSLAASRIDICVCAHTLGKVGANDHEIQCDLRTIDLPLSQKPSSHTGYSKTRQILAANFKSFQFFIACICSICRDTSFLLKFNEYQSIIF